jgi:hypothetical protein
VFTESFYNLFLNSGVGSAPHRATLLTLQDKSEKNLKDGKIACRVSRYGLPYHVRHGVCKQMIDPRTFIADPENSLRSRKKSLEAHP